MAVATVKLVQVDSMFKFYFASNPAELAAQLLREGQYKVYGTMGVDFEGEQAAEEVFDLTNNPSRQEEREEFYGLGRSVSVGDIVNVDGADYLCCPQGWWKI